MEIALRIIRLSSVSCASTKGFDTPDHHGLLDPRLTCAPFGPRTRRARRPAALARAARRLCAHKNMTWDCPGRVLFAATILSYRLEFQPVDLFAILDANRFP